MLAASALAGALAASGQAPLGWWWLSLPALVAIIGLIALAGSARAAWWRGWLAGAGHFAAAMFWIVEPFLVDPARHGWMAPFALLFLAFGLGLFWGAAALLGWWLGRGRRERALTLALAFALAELARGHVLTGLPWALAGHVWIGTPVDQIAALVGASGLTALSWGLAALPVALPRAGLPLALALLGGGWAWGAAQLARDLAPRESAVTVRVVQPNVPQRDKWNPDLVRTHFLRLLDLTAAPADTPPGARLNTVSGARPDVTIWPESAIPWLLDRSGDALAMAAEAAGGHPVILGAERQSEGRYFNSLAVIGPGGEILDLYDKRHLVPFGEYFPGGNMAAALGLSGFAQNEGNGFSPGARLDLIPLGKAGRMLPLICYEAVFAQDLRGTGRADWIVQITNDAWFGHVAGPYQHFAQSRMRAIEQGLPLVRSANTGISAVIDARGRVVGALSLDTEGALDAVLPPALPEPPYARTGDGPLAVLLVACLAFFAFRRFRAPARRFGH